MALQNDAPATPFDSYTASAFHYLSHNVPTHNHIYVPHSDERKQRIELIWRRNISDQVS